MKKTAVQWLIEQLEREYNSFPLLNADACNKALAMEKEQIIEALMTSEIELLSWGISAEKYYNETFKKTNNESNL